MLAAILSTLLLDEQPLWYDLVGMALVLGGIVLTVWRQSHSASMTASSAQGGLKRV